MPPRRVLPALLACLTLTIVGALLATAQDGAVRSVVPAPDRTNVSLGTSLAITFNEPMDWPSVQAALVFTPSFQARFEIDAVGNALILRPTDILQPSTAYEGALKTSVRNALGQPVLAAPYRWRFTTGSLTSETRFGTGTPVQVVTPGGGRGVPTQPQYPRLTLTCYLYRLSTDQFVGNYDLISAGLRDVDDLEGLVPILRWDAQIDATERAAEIALTGVAPGLYILRATHPQMPDAATVVVYSNIVMTAKQGRDGHVLWVTRLPSGQPVGGAAVELLEESGARVGRTTADSDGIARLPSTRGATFAVARSGDDVSVMVLDGMWYSYPYWYANGFARYLRTPPEITGHVHTDRPIYKPGHAAHYKATLRRFTPEGLTPIAASQPLTVTVRDGAGNRISRSAVRADAFGSITGTVALGDEVALGLWSIEVTTGMGDVHGAFQVEEYVKPDFAVTVDTDREFYIRGETARVTVQSDYYFGQPVADAAVVVRVYETAGTGRPISEHEGTTDPSGQWTVDVPLPERVTTVQTYYLEAEVVDASRRPVVAEAAVPVYPSGIALSLILPTRGHKHGHAIPLAVRTSTHDGAAAPDRPVRLEVRQYRYDYHSYREITVMTRTVTTGADGRAETDLAGLDVGWYRLYASAEDDEGRGVTQQTYLWIYSQSRPWYWRGSLTVEPDREHYAVGDTARLLVRSPVTTTALVTIERDEVLHEVVADVVGATTIEVPILPSFASGVTARVVLWEPQDFGYTRAEARVHQAEVEIAVGAESKRLSVAVGAGGRTFEPGDEAEITVRVTDPQGRPVRAQLSLAVVDAAVLALTDDPSGDIFDGFWGPRQRTVDTFDALMPSQWRVYSVRDYSVPRNQTTPMPPMPTGAPGTPSAAPSGTPAAAPTAEPGAAPDPDDASSATPRREFPDTAHWSPALETDASGEVTVRVRLPDTLTTWAAIARAVTVEAQAGQGRGELVVTKAVIADPALPRFAVQGDRFALDVLARNYAGGELEATCTLDAPGLVQLDAGDRALTLPFGETKVARWAVVASETGVGTVTADVTTGAGGDAIELPLEVLPFAVPERFALAGDVTDVTTETFEIPFDAIPEASSIEVLLTPHLALGVLDGLESLISYPYGCVEQTMSRMYPNAVIGRLVLALDIQAPEITSRLDTVMRAGLQKLYGFQLSDGAWGWWHSSRNVYITAYVLHGLQLSREAGFDVDQAVIDRGVTALNNLLPSESDARVRAYALYVLAYLGQGNASDTVALYHNRGGLDAFGLGALAIALDAVGRRDLADEVLDELLAGAQVSGSSASWPPAKGASRTTYYWRTMSSTAKNTAMALAAMARLRPDDPLAPKAARWLMTNRTGRGWGSTHATAFAVLALADYIVASQELWADYAWTVSLDGVAVATGSVDGGRDVSRVPPIDISQVAEQPGPHTVTFRKTGNGPLYYVVAGRLARFHESFDRTESAGHGVDLKRAYEPVAGRAEDDGWHAGDLINVRLTLTLDETMHYLIVEDMLPAGFEALNDGLNTETSHVGGTTPRWRWYGYERKEVRADRVSFFATQLRAGTHTFEYPVRAVTPGSFRVRPAEAYAMYRPEIWGRSASDHVWVDHTRVTARPPLTGDFDKDCRLTAFDASLVADGWPTDVTRDVDGDTDVDVADIAVALDRSGLACGQSVPGLPQSPGEMSLAVREVGETEPGALLDLEIAVGGQGDVRGYDLTLAWDEGDYETVDVTDLGVLGDAASLPFETTASAVRFGAYGHVARPLDGEATVVRVTLRAREDGAAGGVYLAHGQVVDQHGGAYSLHVGERTVRPVPSPYRYRAWLPTAGR